MILSNNIDSIYYFEGVTRGRMVLLDVSDFANFAYTKEIEEFWNHFFALNYNDGNNNIRSLALTDLGDIDDWTTGTSNSTTLTDTRGEILRAKKLGADMILYSDKTITTCRYLGGTILFVFPTLVYETGLFSEKAIWDSVNAHYFIGTDQKIYAYAGGQQLIPIGIQIEDTMFAAIDVSKKNRITVGLDPPKHKLYFFFPVSSTTYAKKAYAHNYKQNPKTWEYHEFNDTVRDFSVFSNTLDWYADGTELAGTYADDESFYADSSFTQSCNPNAVILSHDGYIFKLDERSGKDNASNIPCTYETMDITADGEENSFRTIWFSFNAMSTLATATVDIYYSIDSGDNWTLIESGYSISDASSNVWKQHRLPIDVSTRIIRFKLYQNSSKDLQLRAMHMRMSVQTDRE